MAMPGDPVSVAAQSLGQFAEALTYAQRLSTAAARDQLGWRPERHGVIEELQIIGGSAEGREAAPDMVMTSA